MTFTRLQLEWIAEAATDNASRATATAAVRRWDAIAAKARKMLAALDDARERGPLDVADVLADVASTLEGEAENYRDGDVYQPNGIMLHRRATGARRVIAKLGGGK